jgi:ABC-type dipeptide/oligopeptide/nickel transport system permease component
MLAYFARRMVGAVLSLFVSTLALFSWITYGPGGVIDPPPPPCMHCHQAGASFYEEMEAFFHVDQPWPVSYLAWLFDPTGPKHLPLSQGANVVEEGQAVTYLPGEWLGQFLLVLALTLVLSMLVIDVQRRRRPLAVGLPNYPKGRSLLYQYEHPMRVVGL